jgi:hypothetical protein
MGIFLPQDIARRITQFIAGRADFPFIKKSEIIGAFYLFGRDYGIADEQEAKAAANLARGAVEQAARDVRLYTATPNKMDSRFTRENYTKRSLQIVVDSGSDYEIERDISLSSSSHSKKASCRLCCKTGLKAGCCCSAST